MTENTPENTNGTLPEEFVEDVKQVLENLYDFPYLQRHPLSQSSPPVNGNQTAGQRLRREIIAAIEAHDPGDNVFFRAPHARLYNLLHLHYVEGFTIQEAANELGISTRQAYRDLKRGQISVAEILWANREDASQVTEHAHVDETLLLSEVSRLQSSPISTPVSDLLRTALRAVEKLAQSHDIEFELHAPETAITISTNPSIAQQVIVNLLSHTIKHAQPGRLKLYLDDDGGQIRLRLHFKPQTDEHRGVSDILLQLVDHLGWQCTQFATPDEYVIQLQLTSGEPTILIIDDNEALIDLLKRYLSDQSYRIVAAQQGAEGIRLAQEIKPDLIILDVMMPEMDGWEVLQRLRAYPHLSHTPIIVCSVFNDPELASSLGASLLIPKPIDKETFLNALSQVGVL